MPDENFDNELAKLEADLKRLQAGRAGSTAGTANISSPGDVIPNTGGTSAASPFGLPKLPTTAGQNPTGYWQLSKEPLTSLVFILPFLVLYEVGVFFRGPTGLVNGAAAWLQQLLQLLGFGAYFMLPLLLVGLLLGWQYLTGLKWQVHTGVLLGMLLECALLAVALVYIAKSQRTWYPFALQLGAVQEWWQGLVNYSGAGVYEELLFRLLLLPLLAAGLRAISVKTDGAWWGAVIASSLLFSAAHHVGAMGEPFTLRAFVFRAVAGAFFAILFVYRGFGIAVGTHALYDIFVGIF